MNAPALISAALLWGLIHPAYKPVTTKVYGEGEWVLTVETNNFNHQTRCILVNHHGVRPNILFDGAVISFRFNQTIDKSKSWYQIGSGIPAPWRDQYFELLKTGFLAEAEKLDRPSPNIIPFPRVGLQGAEVIVISTSAKARPTSFTLSGVWPLFAASRSIGCAASFNDGDVAPVN